MIHDADSSGEYIGIILGCDLYEYGYKENVYRNGFLKPKSVKMAVMEPYLNLSG